MARAYAYTVIAVLTWGCSLAVNKAIVIAEREGQRLTPMQVAFWCIAIGWLALLAVLAVRRRLRLLFSVAWRGWLVLAAMGCFGWVASVVALNIAFARLPLPDAAQLGVCLHGRAGDRAARSGERGLLARDLIGELRQVVNSANDNP